MKTLVVFKNYKKSFQITVGISLRLGKPAEKGSTQKNTSGEFQTHGIGRTDTSSIVVGI
jgi:hypothetical protein